MCILTYTETVDKVFVSKSLGGVQYMPKKKDDGVRNVGGERISQLRIERDMSQRELAELLQLEGISLHKNAIQRIESGERVIADYELMAFAKIFSVSIDDLLNHND